METKSLFHLLLDYEKHLESINSSPHTIKNMRSNCKNLLSFLAGNFSTENAPDLRIGQFDAYRQYLHDYRTAKGLPLNPLSINKRVSDIRSFLEFLANRGYIQRKLIDALPYVKTPTLLPSGILDHDEVKELLKKIDTSTTKGYRDRTMMELLYTSGIRAAELCGLDLTSVSLTKATAQVFGKGKKERIVPIGKTALTYIESYIRSTRLFLNPAPDEQALFIDGKGHRLQYHTLRRIINKICTDHSDKELSTKLTAHVFRRSCTTELVRSGANLYHVKDLLGHESLETLRHYTKLTITDLQKTHRKHHPRG